MRSRKRLLLAAGAFACLLAAAALVIAAGLPERSAYTGQVIAGEGIAAPEIGALAPNFSAPTLTGSVELGALRGSPVILNFWATWCAPCEFEMPELQAFQSAHPSARVLAVNLGEPPALVADWLAERGITLDIPLDTRGEIAYLYHLRGQPTTFVIAPDGSISHIFYGATTQQALESVLEL